MTNQPDFSAIIQLKPPKPDVPKTGVKKNGGRRKGAGNKIKPPEEKRIQLHIGVKAKYAALAKKEMQRIADKYNRFL